MIFIIAALLEPNLLEPFLPGNNFHGPNFSPVRSEVEQHRAVGFAVVLSKAGETSEVARADIAGRL